MADLGTPYTSGSYSSTDGGSSDSEPPTDHRVAFVSSDDVVSAYVWKVGFILFYFLSRTSGRWVSVRCSAVHGRVCVRMCVHDCMCVCVYVCVCVTVCVHVCVSRCVDGRSAGMYCYCHSVR